VVAKILCTIIQCLKTLGLFKASSFLFQEMMIKRPKVDAKASKEDDNNNEENAQEARTSVFSNHLVRVLK